MAWERRRNGKRYYYKSFRDAGGKVKKRHYGRGPLAQLAASLDAAAQAERRAAAIGRKEKKRQQEGVEAALDAFCGECEALVEAAVEAAGYHAHGSQWRKRRGRQSTAETG